MGMTTQTMERAHHAAMDGDPTPPARPVRAGLHRRIQGAQGTSIS
jgi:hypothetical protein